MMHIMMCTWKVFEMYICKTLVGDVLDMAKCPQTTRTVYPIQTFEYWSKGAFAHVAPIHQPSLKKILNFLLLSAFLTSSRCFWSKAFFHSKFRIWGDFEDMCPQHVQHSVQCPQISRTGHKTVPTKFKTAIFLLLRDLSYLLKSLPFYVKYHSRSEKTCH